MTQHTLSATPGGRPHSRRPRRALAAAALSLAALACSAAQAAPLDDLRRQVEASQFDQAWATAQANPQLLGDVHFDFLYGVAAINVGRIPDGLLALERHLAAVPANDRARLELARGYFLLGEYTRARAEFEFVLRYNPPASVRSNINGFLQAMQVRESADRRATARLYVEGGLGHDTNVNGGTFRDELQLVFGNVSLVGSPSRQVPDSYAQAAVGGQQLLRVTNRLSVFAGADLDHRANFDETTYDLTSLGGYVGLTQLGAGALWRLTLGSTRLMVGGNRYRDTLQLSAEANVTLSPELSFMGFTQYAEQRHAEADEVRDARAATVGGMFTQAFNDLPGTPTLGLRLSWTQEENLRLRSDLDRDMPLARVFASVTPLPALRLAAGLTAWRQKYGNVDIGFGTVRRDTALSADMTANYALDERWSLRGDLVWSRNKSNQDLYDSSRKAASLKLRYQY
ncbi:MAG: MtrB/PioB family outer membrane beta-barrel protein [Rubrivivax sp.]|nr:MtrB/PioB family outer membrane beta-barrel protein [Rubrivivax sp.]